MKNWIQLKYNGIFICILLLLIVSNVFAAISERALLLEATKPIIILMVLSVYLIRYRYLSPIFILFFLFSFVADAASLLFPDSSIVKASSLGYCLSYLCLIYVVSSKFKHIKFDRIIGIYLLIVFLINAYFLYALFNVLQAIVPDSLEITLFGIKSISLIALAFVSFAMYLNSDTKQSILFLMMALCFLFSNVLYYISYYYIYDWSFVMLDRILYILGLFFLFNFIIEENKSRRKRSIREHISSKNVLA